MDTKKSTALIFGRVPFACGGRTLFGTRRVFRHTFEISTSQSEVSRSRTSIKIYSIRLINTLHLTRDSSYEDSLSDHGEFGILHTIIWTTPHVVIRIIARPTYRRHHSVAFVSHLKEYRRTCRNLGWTLTGPIRLLHWSLIEISAQRMLIQGW